MQLMTDLCAASCCFSRLPFSVNKTTMISPTDADQANDDTNTARNPSMPADDAADRRTNETTKSMRAAKHGNGFPALAEPDVVGHIYTCAEIVYMARPNPANQDAEASTNQMDGAKKSRDHGQPLSPECPIIMTCLLPKRR